jgi:adenylate cyclase
LLFLNAGNKQVTRAIGDVAIPLCISEPHVMSCAIEEGDVLVMGCDGVFDEVSDEMVATILTRVSKSDPQLVALMVRDEAFFLGSTDNISALCAKL